jgi:hypothetical protein
MNGNARTANSLLVGLLLLVLGAPGVFAADDARKPDHPCYRPPYPHSENKDHKMSPEATLLPDPPDKSWFIDDPCYRDAYEADKQLDIYEKKHMNPNPTGVAPVELGIRMYDHGAYTPRPTWLFGAKDPMAFGFLSSGDLRIAADSYDGGTNGKKQSTVAARLNLDMDLALTATERIHAFTRPLDKGGKSFTRYDISGAVDDKFTHNFDFDLDTLFFEGDLGQITGGLSGKPARFDMPIAFGRIPFVTQNGVWFEDAFDGAAFSITAKNIPSLDVSNTDLTFFGGWAQLTTDATPGSSKTGVFGLAGFADARNGYIEYGYGYVNADDDNLSYHNVTAAFTRRYLGRISNSVRLIGNFGQKGDPGKEKTADGLLVLMENSLTPKYLPWGDQLNFVPYLNLFAGFNSPQSLARGGDSGGVLRNTGITFESDGMTAYPTLDATAHDSYGGALGLEYLFDLAHQIVVEGSVVQRRSGSPLPGNEYGIGVRYQQPISPDLIIRFDAMKGFLQGQKDVYGVRAELRLKF